MPMLVGDDLAIYGFGSRKPFVTQLLQCLPVFGWLDRELLGILQPRLEDIVVCGVLPNLFSDNKLMTAGFWVFFEK